MDKQSELSCKGKYVFASVRRNKEGKLCSCTAQRSKEHPKVKQ